MISILSILFLKKDPLDETVQLEKKEHTQEHEIEEESEKEYGDTIEIVKESKDIESLEKNLFFKNFTELEKKFVSEIKKIKEAKEDLMDDDVTVSEFRDIISNIVLSLDNIETFRKGIQKHIEVILKKDEEILRCIRKKIRDEDKEIREKDKERSLRDYMFKNENIDKYLLNLSSQDRLDTGGIDSLHTKQIKALVKEKVDLTKMRQEAFRENDLAKLILTEFRQVLRCNTYEGFYIDQIAKVIHENDLLDVKKMPDYAILDDLFLKMDKLKDLVATEIHLLTTIPNQILELRKEELLDKEDFEFLKQVEDISDIKDFYK
ncbi:MAG: hypothetical protein ACLFUO_03655 [Candidatus Woesearchaeota archaeon]